MGLNGLINRTEFSEFFNNSLAIMLLIDLEDQRIVDVNLAAEKYYGWSHAKLTSMCIDQINTLSSNEIKVEKEKVHNQQRTHFKFRHLKADESVSPFEVFTSKVEIDGKAYLHSIIHDITRQVDADIKLQETNEYLENLFTYAYAPIIVWDNSLIITRLNRAFEILSGYSDNKVIGKHIELNKDEYLSCIKESTTGKSWETIEIEIQQNEGTIRTLIWNSDNILDSSKQNIIDDIVLYSRLQSKNLSLDNNAFNVCDLFYDLKQLFCLPEYLNGIELLINNKAECPIKIAVDYEKLKQVFTSLISNALKYTPSGKISFGTESIDKNQFVFYVKDTGIGIVPNEIEKVFERFFRGSNTHKESMPGTGHGLSIAKEIIELLGGIIWVESKLGEGSIFYFTICDNN